jgi:hypothetical protein
LRGVSGNLQYSCDTGLTNTVDVAVSLRATTPGYSVTGGTLFIYEQYGLHIADHGHGTYVNLSYGLFIANQTPSYGGTSYAIYSGNGAHRFGSSSATIGFYGATPTACQVLATGAGKTVDNVISALQALGLVKQS